MHSEPLEIAALTGKPPMGVINKGVNTLRIIISRDVLDRMIRGVDTLAKSVNTDLYMRSDDPMRLQENIEEYLKSVGTGIRVYNVYQSRQTDEQMVLLMSVFTYGFMALITAICIANILNTISTSIAQETRVRHAEIGGHDAEEFHQDDQLRKHFLWHKSAALWPAGKFCSDVPDFNALGGEFSYEFIVPWSSVAVVVVSVFVIVGVAMLYSSAKVRKENIIDVLKQEII